MNTLASEQSGARIVGANRSDSAHEGPGPDLLLADTITGDRVVNMMGVNLGTIDGIMLDIQRGRVAYAVLAVGGLLGLGEKLFAIPWSALTMDAQGKRFILDADEDRIKNAPGFDKDRWSSMADSSWAIQVHDYYQRRPYWEIG